MSGPMMKCGHAAMSTCNKRNGQVFDPPIPTCVICDCTEIDPSAPDLTGRKARCSYFNQRINPPGTYHGSECGKCNQRYREKNSTICQCQVPSSTTLGFFAYTGPGSKHYSAQQGPKEFDQYYCGCASWE